MTTIFSQLALYSQISSIGAENVGLLVQIRALICADGPNLITPAHERGNMSGDRATVKTYVPRYQKEAWVEHAEALGMSQSEFVRTMVQAGRADFDLPAPPGRGAGAGAAPTKEAEGTPERERIVEALREGPRDWDELLEELTADAETRLEDALTALQDAGRVRYSGREGGYVLTDE